MVILKEKQLHFLLSTFYADSQKDCETTVSATDHKRMSKIRLKLWKYLSYIFQFQMRILIAGFGYCTKKTAADKL